MSNAYNNASLIVPVANYEAGTIFSLVPTDGSGDLSFTRAGSKMVRNSAGLWETIGTNIPPLHYPVGGGCPSWLFEAEATNNALHSTDFSNAVWAVAGTAAKAASALSTNIVGVTPYDISGLGAQSTNYFEQSVGGFAGVSFQVFIKATVIGDVGLTINLTSNNAIDTNITLTEEWQEFSVYNAGSNGSPRLSAGTATKCTISYIGVVNSSTATSPIITAGSSVTRFADNIDTPVSQIGRYEGTFYFEGSFSSTSKEGLVLFGTSTIGTNSITIGCHNSGVAMTAIYANSVYQAILSAVNAVNTFCKMAVVYKSGVVVALFVNGNKYNGTFTTFNEPLTNFRLGDSYSIGSRGVNCKPIQLYQTALSDSEAIALTTL